MPPVVVRRVRKIRVSSGVSPKSQRRETLLSGNAMEELPPESCILKKSVFLPSSIVQSPASLHATKHISKSTVHRPYVGKPEKLTNSPGMVGIEPFSTNKPFVPTGDAWVIDWAVVTIQAAWRGYRLKRKYRRMQRRYHRARCVRRRQQRIMLLASQTDAATKIQCAHRSKQAQKLLVNLKEDKLKQQQYIQATRIQACIRGRQGRKKVARYLRKKRILKRQSAVRLQKKRNAAAISIQKLVRSYRARRVFEHKRKCKKRYARSLRRASRRDSEETLQETNLDSSQLKSQKKEKDAHKRDRLGHSGIPVAQSKPTISGKYTSSAVHKSSMTPPKRSSQESFRRNELKMKPGVRKNSNLLKRRRSMNQSSSKISKKHSIDSTIVSVRKSESQLQSQLTGLWTGECLDSSNNVVQITDAVLRFFIDSETGQSSIEGRSKSSSGTSGAGVLLFQGVYEAHSSRFILVLEGAVEKQTYMGWLKPCRPESAKMAISALGKEMAQGVGFTLEGNSSTGHIHLRKRENTSRAAKASIEKLILQAKNQCMMKQGNGARSMSKVKDRRRRKKHRGGHGRRKSVGLSAAEGSFRSEKQLMSVQADNIKDDSKNNKVQTKCHSSSSSPLVMLSSYFGMFHKRTEFQLKGAKRHLNELAGPLNRTPEHMEKMRKDIDRVLSRCSTMRQDIKALQTKLSLFGYHGIEESLSMKKQTACFFQGIPAKDVETCPEESMVSEESELRDMGDGPKHKPPLIASSVFEALRPDFLPSSATGGKHTRNHSRSSSRASSRGSNSSLLSRGSSRGSARSTRSRGSTPIASKRLAKFFTTAKAGITNKSNQSCRQTSKPAASILSLADLPSSRVKMKSDPKRLYRRRIGRITLDPMIE